MPQVEPLGLLGIEGVHYYVRDLERSRRFYVDRLDFSEIGESGSELTAAGRQQQRARGDGALRSSLGQRGVERRIASLGYAVH